MFRPYPVRIVSGPHAGRAGYVVSVPWLGNLWNLRATVNVPAVARAAPAGLYPLREWVAVWGWQIMDDG